MEMINGIVKLDGIEVYRCQLATLGEAATRVAEWLKDQFMYEGVYTVTFISDSDLEALS